MVGYYTGDEPALTRQPQTFHQYGLIKGGDPSGFTLCGVQHAARPAVMEGHRRYSGRRCVSAGGGDRQRSGRGGRSHSRRVPGLHGARPVWTVIQFFQLDLESAWPTEQQLHDMSWMAIVEGATGLFYWEYGIRGLASVKDPVEHAALYQELINVTTEIKSLEPVLLSPDAPVITDNSAAGTVFTKTKVGADGTRYLFRVQLYCGARRRRVHAGAHRRPASSITTPAPACAPDTSTTFSGGFQPYQAHVFLISNSRRRRRRASMRDANRHANAPTPTPTVTAPPTAAPHADRDADSDRDGTATATATPTATATATATPTASATPTATATPGRVVGHRRRS